MSNTALKVVREYGKTMPKELLSQADHMETERFQRAITDTERAVLSSGVTELSITEEDLKDAKKEQMAHFNGKLKILALEKKANLKAIRSGRTEVEEMVFTYYDTEYAMTHKYTEEGALIASRSMTPTEAQLQIR